MTDERLAVGTRVLFGLSVVGQIVLAGMCVLQFPFPRHPFTLLLLGLGVGLGAWALHTLGRRNLSTFPQVRAGAQLVTAGPYRWVRHPMYAALLLVCGAFAISHGGWYAAAVWSLLAWVLMTKARWEERQLAERFAPYAAYRRTTKRFVPFVW